MNLFVANAIFDNFQANTFCDEICNLLASGNIFPSNLALSGKAARELQRENFPSPVDNIIFRIDDWAAYMSLSEKLSVYSVRNYQKYQERLMFTYAAGKLTVCFEIWFSSTPLNRVFKNNIMVENQANIPLNLL